MLYSNFFRDCVIPEHIGFLFDEREYEFSFYLEQAPSRFSDEFKAHFVIIPILGHGVTRTGFAEFIKYAANNLIALPKLIKIYICYCFPAH